MLVGTNPLSLDAKGRVAIPARYRDELVPDGAQLVVTAHPHGCLLVYSFAAWQPIYESLVKIPSLDPRAALLKRLFIGHAQVEQLDSAGRVLLGVALREWAALEKQVVMVGQGTHCELWSEHRWATKRVEMSALESSDYPASFTGLAL